MERLALAVRLTLLSGLILVFLLSLLLASGCRSGLEPAPRAQRVDDLQQAALHRVDGVRVVAQADEWPGPADVKGVVTPVRVAIENGGTAPLRVRYDQFALIGSDGTRLAALPPFRIEGEVAMPVERPSFGHSDFAVAPRYGGYYPGMARWGGPFAYDPSYYSTHHPRWVETDLPTEAMLQWALPEGVVQPGGSVDGFLYFEEVPGHLREVVFRADLVNARTGGAYGEARIPFRVE